MMDYMGVFKEKHVQDNPEYLHNDIGIAKLFYDIHSKDICYVWESKTWYSYNGKRWVKDDGGLGIMEHCKGFVQALGMYAKSLDNKGDEREGFIKYATGFHARRKREGLLSDARSIAPKSLADFDRNKKLLNCQNGTFNLENFGLQPHSPDDYITKIARVRYDHKAVCPRWEGFVDEVMCGDTDTAVFLQKALGYALTGDTSLECFFILYGNTTRNGKTTLSETVAHLLGDYARTIQPQTLARRSNDGSAASPDIARLKGARLVNMPEPEKGLELNIALVKQLTGGDTYTGRFLHENPVEFCPEFKIFVNTNHLPRTSDDTVFTSGRVKLIPFDRHFAPEEQDSGLKMLFRKKDNMSGILNWMIDGYRLLLEVGLDVPQRVDDAIAAYRQETDIIGQFLSDCTAGEDGNRLPASEIYSAYTSWAKDNGYRQMNNKNFIAELRRRFEVRRDGIGTVIIGITMDYCQNPLPL